MNSKKTIKEKYDWEKEFNEFLLGTKTIGTPFHKLIGKKVEIQKELYFKIEVSE